MFRTSQQWYGSGGGSICEVRSLTFQGESPMSGLNWFCLAMSLLKALFSERRLSSGENLRSSIARRRRWCTVPFLEESLLKSLGFRYCLGGGCITVASVGIL
jgi:hypothetical protein